MSARSPQAPPERRLSLLLLVLAANQRLGQLVERELAADGVEAPDYGLLSLVGVRGPARLTELAAELGMPLTTASDAMRRLETRGHAARGPNPEDGRSVLFALTPEGDEAWRRGWPALQRINRFLQEELDDPAAVREALERLGDAFSAGLASAALGGASPDT
jgi:MarR family transcriptional regulator, organic hydroperoxide resistance regulator